MEGMIKVDKGIARKMYRNGLTIHLIPCRANLHPEWIQLTPINITKVSTSSFDVKVDEYIYYNCNGEIGRYPHYYVSKEDYEKYNMMCN